MITNNENRKPLSEYRPPSDFVHVHTKSRKIGENKVIKNYEGMRKGMRYKKV